MTTLINVLPWAALALMCGVTTLLLVATSRSEERHAAPARPAPPRDTAPAPQEPLEEAPPVDEAPSPEPHGSQRD